MSLHVTYGLHCIDSLKTENCSYLDIFNIEFNQNRPVLVEHSFMPESKVVPISMKQTLDKFL